MQLEQIITNLVLNGGEGKSQAIEAIRFAKQGDFEKAKEHIKLSGEAISKAHNFQTELLQKEASGESPVEFSLLVVHGQDHLMNAMTTRDLAKEMVDLYEELYAIKNK